ncbi:hypothetical protein [Deinococcus peraridilitoris]|uniref:Uncharacterized protein n=1 Tax=Deinococcus peraridilitoris (strain DSM 19664 / LMG 22246 / CIP 109416 / KR-200) TaxID=937777 RepID=L0A6Z8_DEIPD|nr:hypothetical protein [Deinococcus peraridilitoris]AFZ69628.1 hypothetical protein Deipe_4285 [Deinococcus peraridilitoris DSM 19664]
MSVRTRAITQTLNTVISTAPHHQDRDALNKARELLALVHTLPSSRWNAVLQEAERLLEELHAHEPSKPIRRRTQHHLAREVRRHV